MMWVAALALLAGVCVFGAVMKRAGRASAQLETLRRQRRADEEAKRVVEGNDSLSHAELLEWLRHLRAGR